MRGWGWEGGGIIQYFKVDIKNKNKKRRKKKRKERKRKYTEMMKAWNKV